MDFLLLLSTRKTASLRSNLLVDFSLHTPAQILRQTPLRRDYSARWAMGPRRCSVLLGGHGNPNFIRQGTLWDEKQVVVLQE